jgi:putative spermidine/putrescine transport system ATP-binding protein
VVKALAVNVAARGDRTLLSVRPERVEINPGQSAADVTLKGRIAELIYLGDHIRARLHVAGHDDFVVKVPNKAGHEHVVEGNEVSVGWKAADCRALDFMEFSH